MASKPSTRRRSSKLKERVALRNVYDLERTLEAGEKKRTGAQVIQKLSSWKG